MGSSLRGRFTPSTETPQLHHRHRSTLQTSQLHHKHRSTTQTWQPHHRHRALNTAKALAMIGGQVGWFSKESGTSLLL